MTTGVMRGRPIVHDAGVTRVAISPDSKWGASGDVDGMAKLWDFDSSHVIGLPFRYRTHRGFQDISFCRNSDRLMIASQDLVQLWPLPKPVTESAEQLEDRIEKDTGFIREEDGTFRLLLNKEWRDRFLPSPVTP
jgi:WD40 repeat protein